ncbi:MAG TPA: 3-oxoacid CoA-transferase subunit B [Chloroflexota bacterium]|nr:3-oxoacid CoA-transferase subunit B [Chloroflexota bacterium]
MDRHTVLSAQDAVADVFDGAMICVGGFGPIKNRPIDLLTALAEQPRSTHLTIVSNGFPHQPLAENHQVKKLIGAFGGSVYRRAAASEEQIRSGELEFEPSPQGIFTERLRAGAGGIAAFFSPVGVHTAVAADKERRTIDGRDYILETALRPDFGLIRAAKADLLGNLTGTGSTLNFHPVMAAASRVTIAEVDEIVPVGAIAAEDVKVPGIYVDRLVLHDRSRDAQSEAEEQQRRRRREIAATKPLGLNQDQMALRAAQLLKPGQYVNLGMGIPTRVANYISADSGVLLHAENGILGYGPEPSEAEYRWDYYNAQGQPVTVLPGGAVFDSFAAFTMARGGHLDVVILGGLQVSAAGDLANWWAPHMAAGGMGGAMDLCTDVPELIVIMDHTTREGEPKILNACTYPLTAPRCVTKIVTDLAYIEVRPTDHSGARVDNGRLILRELAPGVSVEYVQQRTEPPLELAPDLREMRFSPVELALAP